MSDRRYNLLEAELVTTMLVSYWLLNTMIDSKRRIVNNGTPSVIVRVECSPGVYFHRVLSRTDHDVVDTSGTLSIVRFI